MGCALLECAHSLCLKSHDGHKSDAEFFCYFQLHRLLCKSHAGPVGLSGQWLLLLAYLLSGNAFINSFSTTCSFPDFMNKPGWR